MVNMAHTKKQRDTQRARVYKCDEILRPLSRADVSTVPLMQAYVQRVWTSERVRGAYPNAHTHYGRPTVGDGRARRSAGGNSQGIWMPKWSRHESIVLHELAHTYCQRVYGWHVAGHGWQYCSVYLRLVLYMMGRHAHDTLQAAFKKHRVRFTAPRQKRPMSPEQKAALVARLAAYRAARQAHVLARFGEPQAGDPGPAALARLLPKVG